jgi:hypothetical protein
MEKVGSRGDDAMSGQTIYMLCGVWALGIVIIFIQAIRLSYKIEARSPELANRYGFPVNAQMFHTVTNYKVARDAETQALRKRMNRLLLICVAGMIAMGVAINWVQSSQP